MQHNPNKNLDKLNDNLKSKIFGQDSIIDEITNTIKINALGLGNEDKPVASFLFKGSTGVGKTELAIELSKQLHLDFKRFDMSEYSTEYSVKNLIGGDNGLVGFEAGGILTNYVKDNPKSILLFDEIEKADSKVMNIFLQILDYGKLTSSKGFEVYFDEAIIIFTSNLGSKQSVQRSLGFQSKQSIEIDNDIDTFLAPEFIGRLDSILTFNSLSKEMIRLIIDKFILKLSNKLRSKYQLFLEIDDSVKDDIVEESLILNLGARSIDKIIRNKIKIKIANEIILNKFNGSNTLFFTLNKENHEYEISLLKRENVMVDKTTVFDEIYFTTSVEAQDYAKLNLGVAITRSSCGNGYIVKSR